MDGVTGAMPEPAATADAKVESLPAHSPLGASSAERWMNCSGSVALIQALYRSPEYQEEEPDYRTDGVQAHALAAWCLEKELSATEAWLESDFSALDEEMLDAVQVYLDYVTTLPGRRYIETRVHRPEFHPMFYGTLDFCAEMVSQDVVEIVDYKHGIGVYVEIVENVQLRYYAYGRIGEDREEYPDETRVKLTIVQPRCPGEPPIRSWETTAGAIREWAKAELLPAMDRTINERFLSLGEWCRFCPAKILCPAMSSLADEMLSIGDPKALGDEALGRAYERMQLLRMLMKVVEEEAKIRALGGRKLPGVKVVPVKADRAWKGDAPIVEKWGDAAWQPRKLVSPAAAEKMPGGKDFVAEWAFKPDAGLTIAPESDRRAALVVKSGQEKFGDAGS